MGVAESVEAATRASEPNKLQNAEKRMFGSNEAGARERCWATSAPSPSLTSAYIHRLSVCRPTALDYSPEEPATPSAVPLQHLTTTNSLTVTRLSLDSLGSLLCSLFDGDCRGSHLLAVPR